MCSVLTFVKVAYCVIVSANKWIGLLSLARARLLSNFDVIKVAATELREKSIQQRRWHQFNVFKRRMNGKKRTAWQKKNV